MNIVDILIGLVGGGAIGGGALYALQQGKITSAVQKYEKTRSALDATESELKDKKGKLKLLDVSETRIREIEARYREQVAQLQQELDSTRARLEEVSVANPAEEVEASYKAQMRELQQGYETQLEELHQAHQVQVQEIIGSHQGEVENLRQDHQNQVFELQNGHQSRIQAIEQGHQTQLLGLQQAAPFVAELPVYEEYQPTQFKEPWEDLSDSPSAEFIEFIETPALIEESIAEISSLEDLAPPNPGFFDNEEVSPEIDFLDSPQSETPAVASDDFLASAEFLPETGIFDDFSGVEPEAEFLPEPGAFDGFSGVQPEAEFSPELRVLNGFSEVPSSAEFLPEIGIFDGSSEVRPEAEFLPETVGFDDFSDFEKISISGLDEETVFSTEISSSDLDFLNSLQLDEEATVSSLEELAEGNDAIFVSEVSSDDASFFDLLPTDEERLAEDSFSTDFEHSIEDLFADSGEPGESKLFDPFALETPKSEINGHNSFPTISTAEELDFFNMLDSSETGTLESLPDDENLDELFSEDLFSEWDNGKPSYTDKLESHPNS